MQCEHDDPAPTSVAHLQRRVYMINEAPSKIAGAASRRFGRERQPTIAAFLIFFSPGYPVSVFPFCLHERSPRRTVRSSSLLGIQSPCGGPTAPLCPHKRIPRPGGVVFLCGHPQIPPYLAYPKKPILYFMSVYA